LASLCSVDGRVVLLEGRCRSIVFRVQTRRVSSVTVTRVKCAVVVISGHDKVAAHLVQGVLAFQSSGCLVTSSNTDSDADLVVRNVVHPLFVEDVGSTDVGRNVSSYRVTETSGSVWVKLTTFVTCLHTDSSKVTESHNLNV
jgi:hypothetical protein